MTRARYSLWISRLRISMAKRCAKALLRARITMPDTGASRR